MEYTSTRDNGMKVSSARAIAQGISKEGGLFVPESLPRLTAADIDSLVPQSYIQRATAILSGFLTDFTAEELEQCVTAAYGSGNFPGDAVAPLAKLNDNTYMLELWHGPTCAFKDMALQLLPHLLTVSAKKEAGDKEIVILVATSGDTGKAALAGFQDVPGTRILVFYPQDGVSKVQKLQMATQEGANVAVQGVYGNFDDAQTGVKQLFTDPTLAARLDEKGLMFSSANSINWGRLVPQIVYYVSAYCDMIASGEIANGEAINVCVPTGNFGNILAAYYAAEMGVPINRLICASNVNKVLTDFIHTGTYDRRRELILTTSPSMDILISSNLERLLYALSGRDDKSVGEMMARLSGDGIYTVDDKVKQILQTRFWGGFCDEKSVMDTIKDVHETYSYLCDTHTAVAIGVHRQYMEQTEDATKTLIASTANPYKFAPSIWTAISGQLSDADEFDQIDMLHAATGMEIPPQILELKQKPVRFTESCAKEDMGKAVEGMLNLWLPAQKPLPVQGKRPE
ncbi:threonine synthase [Ruminococcaceae bacterium OttesenSCG-928-L11]|nr:threonine synthase [Ruminococcaceae bacterium OttesenSCG-928-L11]